MATTMALVATPAPWGATAWGAPCTLTGDGTLDDPYLVSTSQDLECLRSTPAYWGPSEIRQTADIDMTGVTWSAGIASPSQAFSGNYDGAGHVISNLSISAMGSDARAAFISETTGTSTISRLGLVNITAEAIGIASRSAQQLYAAAFVGYADLGTSIRESFSSGRISAKSDAAIAQVYAGGLVAYSGFGIIVDSYSTAAVSSTALQATEPSSWESSVAGGIGGRIVSDVGVAPIAATRSFASGPVSVRTGGADAFSGGVAGLFAVSRPGSTTGSVEGIAWDVESSGQIGCTLAVGVTGSCLGLTTARMQSADEFLALGWSISYGLTGSTTWGLCPRVNGGYPFLRAFPVTGPCESVGPPPWYQGYARTTSTASCDVDWYPSWAQWPNGNTGGFVCSRKQYYSGGRWLYGPPT